MVQYNNKKIMEIANMADLVVCNFDETDYFVWKGSIIQETIEKDH